MQQVVVRLDVEGGHGGRSAAVHRERQVNVARLSKSCECGQSLQSHDGVLRNRK